MVQVTFLLENTSEDITLRTAHGLSMLIEFEDRKILLDTGPNSDFYKNAKKMKIDLCEVEVLLLSHAHYDHTGGLDKFCKVNKNSEILMQYTHDKYYSVSGIQKKFIGLNPKIKNLARIRMLTQPCQITKNSWFIPCTVNHYGTPNLNSGLFKKIGKNFFPDDFKHEGIFVINDNSELVIFNSCSHRGVINSIESAREFFPNKKVRSYVGGFHFPYAKGQNIRPEDLRNFEELIDYTRFQTNLTLYTGHCTGDQAFDYLENALGKGRIKHFSTGKTFCL
ncbi:MAG: MBL fold metallo-hydrolase [Treponemataceae bacterium]